MTGAIKWSMDIGQILVLKLLCRAAYFLSTKLCLSSSFQLLVLATLNIAELGASSRVNRETVFLSSISN